MGKKKEFNLNCSPFNRCDLGGVIFHLTIFFFIEACKGTDIEEVEHFPSINPPPQIIVFLIIHTLEGRYALLV